jgi:hypothetical protein
MARSSVHDMADLGDCGGGEGAPGARPAALPVVAEIHEFMARLASGDGAGMSDAERIDFLRATEELKCVSEGAQAQVTLELVASQRSEQARQGVRAERQG